MNTKETDRKIEELFHHQMEQMRAFIDQVLDPFFNEQDKEVYVNACKKAYKNLAKTQLSSDDLDLMFQMHQLQKRINPHRFESFLEQYMEECEGIAESFLSNTYTPTLKELTQH
ncbi:hypothetical protein CMI37_08590 [Candidatus Pacearchaeota archaeon]|nr:hypothetical protein [Candidatus Pacearchaeota archaeon]